MKVKFNCRSCIHRDVCKHRVGIGALANSVSGYDGIDIYMECKNFIPKEEEEVERKRVEPQESDEESDMEDGL